MKMMKNKVFALFAAAILAVTGVTGFVGCAPTTNTSAADTKPAAVKNLKAKAGNGEVTLTWTNPTAKSFKGVEVYVEEKLEATLDKSKSSYKVTGLTNGKEYTFSVFAYFDGYDELDNSLIVSVSATPAEKPAVSSVEFAENLVIGWNLGNTLDATATWTKDTETAWGMPKTTEAMIKAVHAAGFETIRIPVSWHNHVSGTDNKIDSSWMSRVKTVVDWAISDGMYVIINIHHDNLRAKATDDAEGMDTSAGFCLSDDSSIQTKSKKYIADVWTQIATTFKDYDEHLIFEVLNEPRDIGGKYEWYMPDLTTSKKWNNIITQYEQVGLDTIRSIAGNEDRFVMVPAYAASGTSQTILGGYTLPTDTATDKLLLSTHAYSPNGFALDGDMTKVKFLDSYKSELDSIFNYLKTNYVSKGIGVVMGEASATDKDNTEERIKWAEYYFGKAKACKISVVLWDNMVPYPTGTDGAERHGHFNRYTRTWYHPELIEAMVAAAGGSASDAGNQPSEDPKDPAEPFTAVTIFDAESFTAPDGMEIVTLDGKKYLKVTINGYSTSFTIPAVDCNGATTFKVDCRAAEATSDYQVIIGIKDSEYGDISTLTMNPLKNEATELTGGVATSGAKLSTTKVASVIQPMAQNTEDWAAANGIVFYISKITAE